jgi:heptosyltransferase-2
MENRVWTKIQNRIARKFRHLIDTYFWEKLFGEIGMPIWVRVRFRRRNRVPPKSSEVRTVLVWNIDSLGDSLWITPSLRALRVGYPHAKITLACNKKVQDIFLYNRNLDEVIGIDPEPFYSAKGYLRALPELEQRSFDVMIVLEAGSRPADRGRLLGRSIQVGYLVSSELGIFKTLPDAILAPNTGRSRRYWPQYFMKGVELLGIPPVAAQLEVFWSVEEAEKIRGAWGHSNDYARIAIQPGVAPYASLTKKWPFENFVELITDLLERYQANVFVTGSFEEREEGERLIAAVRKRTQIGDLKLVAGEFTVREMPLFLKSMNLVVTADTAALHLAEVAQVPVIALFGATDPELIASKRAGLVVLTEKLPCRPCHQTQDHMPFWPQCIFPSPHCLERITSSRVFEEAQRLLVPALRKANP